MNECVIGIDMNLNRKVPDGPYQIEIMDKTGKQNIIACCPGMKFKNIFAEHEWTRNVYAE